MNTCETWIYWIGLHDTVWVVQQCLSSQRRIQELGGCSVCELDSLAVLLWLQRPGGFLERHPLVFSPHWKIKEVVLDCDVIKDVGSNSSVISRVGVQLASKQKAMRVCANVHVYAREKRELNVVNYYRLGKLSKKY